MPNRASIPQSKSTNIVAVVRIQNGIAGASTPSKNANAKCPRNILSGEGEASGERQPCKSKIELLVRIADGEGTELSHEYDGK